jgi:cell division protein FtsQ
MTKRGSAVLDAPEQRYVSGTGGPRRAAAGLRRDVQEGYGRDFEDDFEREFGAAEGDSERRDEGTPVRRRSAGRGGVRRYGFLAWLPQTLWGRIGAGVGVVAVLGVVVGGALAVRSMVLHDERFVIPTSAAIAIEGNKHVTKAQLLSIFGGDVERNIFTVSLAERRAELERMPWVEHATVMRLLPDHLRVSIVERVPVAFVRQGGHIGLVDKSGVLMDMVSSAGEQYSFPVVTGISADEPLSTRAARMKIFERFTSELDAGGGKISEGLSEVDLSSPEDVKAMIPDDSTGSSKGEVLVHFGESDFLERYNKYKSHLAEWRAQYPNLVSVDLRYDRQAVLEMQRGSAVPVSGTGGTADAAKSDAGKVAAAVAAPAVHPVVKTPAVATSGHAAVPAVSHPAAAAKPIVVAGAASSGQAHASASADSTATPGVTQSDATVTHHLMVAKDVPSAKKPVAKPGSKKAAVKKKAPVKKAAAPAAHPAAVQP